MQKISNKKLIVVQGGRQGSLNPTTHDVTVYRIILSYYLYYIILKTWN